MKFEVNIEKKYFYFILSVIIISAGVFAVNALTPGVAPNPGHLISEVAPPSGCSSGQFLKWTGTAWACETVSTSTGETIFDLINGLHSSAQCTANGGVVRTISAGKVCVFSEANCATGFSRYLNWSTTSAVIGQYDGVSTCYLEGGGDSGQDISQPCGPPAYGYEVYTGKQSCNTGYHTWANTAQESCSYCSACTTFFDCCAHNTVYAKYTEVGCY